MNNGPVKQLTNFAKVIQVDKDGKPIQPTPQQEETKVVLPPKKEIVIKEENPMIAFYIIIILILVAILIAFIGLYVVPRMI